MSDLAPFVAAALPQPDAVLNGQQSQIHGLHHQVRSLQGNVETLQRRLQERNPLRSIRIQGGGGAAAAEPQDHYNYSYDPTNNHNGGPTTNNNNTNNTNANNTNNNNLLLSISDEWNAQQANEEYRLDLFPDHDDVHTTLGAFLKARLLIDHQTAIAAFGQQLTFTTLRFAYCAMIQLEYLYVRAEYCTTPQNNDNNNHAYYDDDDDDDHPSPLFVMHLYIAPVTVEEYSRATGAALDTFVATGCIHTRDETERSLSYQGLLTLGAHKPVKIAFDEGSCYAQTEFLLDHLQVPYVP
ncbi:hypothetical protein ACA910_018932 [Epithemia clementina (nom. ined.)]